MLFNSLTFLIFFPIVLLVYFVIPKRIRYVWLLVASIYFYASWNVKYTLLLLSSIAITYGASLVIGKYKENKAIKNTALTLSLLLNFGALFIFKYFNFTTDLINKFFSKFGVEAAAPTLSLILPMGISFYIFQAVGYTIDVYRGSIEPEKNPLKYALFVSFFPQLVAGPIERSGNLLPQIQNIDKIKLFDTDRIVKGALTMLYGYFMKMVMADRLAILVDKVFDTETFIAYDGTTFLIAALFFTLQIYCDFAGYTYIAIGAARVMGVNLMNNFNTPYFATSIKDFWDRWHISLTTWFRDYLYFPLGGSRKGKVRKYINIMVIFLVSGLWHGASLHYVVWGAIHGIMRVVGELTTKIRTTFAGKIHYDYKTPSHKFLKMSITFILVLLAWIFFRAESTMQAIYIIKEIFVNPAPWVLTDGSLLNLGLTAWDLNVIVLGVIIMATVDMARYWGHDLVTSFARQNLWFKFILLLLGIIAIVLTGIYGANYNQAAFIYFQF